MIPKIANTIPKCKNKSLRASHPSEARRNRKFKTTRPIPSMGRSPLRWAKKSERRSMNLDIASIKVSLSSGFVRLLVGRNVGPVAHQQAIGDLTLDKDAAAPMLDAHHLALLVEQ